MALNKFTLGMLAALMVTTNEGRQITNKALKVGVKLGDKTLKNKLGIDMKELLSEIDEEEKKGEIQNDTPL